jgi:hypothetical protein
MLYMKLCYSNPISSNLLSRNFIFIFGYHTIKIGVAGSKIESNIRFILKQNVFHLNKDKAGNVVSK